MNFQEMLLEKTTELNLIIEDFMPTVEGKQALIMETMRYAMQGGGKRIRPMLMFETYRLFGGSCDIIQPFLVAIEMIHTYSLVHDDLPAMDNDEYRRGRKTTHIVYGEDMGILSGDALLTYAFELVSKLFVSHPEDAVLIGQAIGHLATKAGIYGMIGGQVVDVKKTGHVVDQETLDFIYQLKTSALLESSMMIGATLAGASRANIELVERVASNIGLAFQIQDDILDITSSMEELGKATHSDEKNQKMTYVSLYGIEQASKMVEEKSLEAIELIQNATDVSPTYDGFLVELIRHMIHRRT